MSVAFGFAPRSLPARLASKSGLQQRVLRCGHLLAKPGSTPACRWIGSQRIGDTVGRPLACTWLTTTPERVTPDDVLSSIPDSDSETVYTPIFLVTPAFAHWVDSRNAFLEQWMNRFYHKALDFPSREPLHAIVAVVDRLPDNSRGHGNAAGDKALTESEGISILFAKPGDVQGKAAAPRQVRSVESEVPTLLFSFQNKIEHTPGKAVHQPIHEIGLRLAETIFVNGKENTLFGTRWAYDPALKTLSLEESIDLSTCLVRVTRGYIHNSLNLPLHPVGERRKVFSSMGNILRQIAKHADGKSNEPMPASSELEKELPRYIAEHNITDQRISVWALIETWEESPFADSRYSHDSLAKSIQMGGKLHRVMSGGGGWGKKQGLLSLDPEMSFRQADNDDLFSLEEVFTPKGESSMPDIASILERGFSMEDLSTLSQAAGPGDYVQFFASVENPGQRSQKSSPPSPEGLSCHFGVMADVETLSADTAQQKDLVFVPNYFGALSEKAITYLQPVVGATSADVLKSRTKIDVPGSRVKLVLE